MKGTKYGIYCTVREAAAVLGMYPEDVRRKMQAGELCIGKVQLRNSRCTYLIERDKVLRAAGITEWPHDLVTQVPTKRAAYAAEKLKQNGMDTERIAAVLRDADVITAAQYKAMLKGRDFDEVRGTREE
jgi:hypothetical protein